MQEAIEFSLEALSAQEAPLISLISWTCLNRFFYWENLPCVRFVRHWRLNCLLHVYVFTLIPPKRFILDWLTNLIQWLIAWDWGVVICMVIERFLASATLLSQVPWVLALFHEVANWHVPSPLQYIELFGPVRRRTCEFVELTDVDAPKAVCWV